MIDAPPPKAPAAPDEDEPPVLPDPYHVEPPPPPPPVARAGLLPAALWSVLSALLLGPVGAILAIFLGTYARREIARAGTRRSGAALALAGIVLGALLVPLWGLGLTYVIWTQVHHDLPAAGDDPESPPGMDDPTDPDDPAAPAPGGLPGMPGQAGPRLPLVVAPRHTRIAHEGRITVVDLGMDTSSVADALARQRAEAATEGETLLLMTTAGRCDPCRGVDQSLTDARLQTALAKVRLVRVDIVAFHEDLEALRIPDARIPGFYLLALDLAPRDGIDGGEWDADIPVNIAPVLGAFLRGKYAERREPWRPLPGSGMTL